MLKAINTTIRIAGPGQGVPFSYNGDRYAKLAERDFSSAGSNLLVGQGLAFSIWRRF
jgi:hypothetical protein